MNYVEFEGKLDSERARNHGEWRKLVIPKEWVRWLIVTREGYRANIIFHYGEDGAGPDLAYEVDAKTFDYLSNVLQNLAPPSPETKEPGDENKNLGTDSNPISNLEVE